MTNLVLKSISATAATANGFENAMLNVPNDKGLRHETLFLKLFLQWLMRFYQFFLRDLSG